MQLPSTGTRPEAEEVQEEEEEVVEEEDVVAEPDVEVEVGYSVIEVGVLLMLVEVARPVDPSLQPGTRSGQLHAEI